MQPLGQLICLIHTPMLLCRINMLKKRSGNSATGLSKAGNIARGPENSGMLKFIRNNFRWIAGGFVLTFFSSFGQTYFISGSIAEWQATFDLSHGQIGRIYMFATLGSAVCLPFLGRLVDSIPAHRMIAFVIPTLAVATLMAGYASSVLVLITAIFLLRLFGQGMMTHMALTATGRWFAVERGRAVSLVVLGHQGGEATLPLAFSAIAIAYGYQAGWIAGAVALLVVGLPFSYWAYLKAREPQGHEAKADAARGFRE